MKALFLTVLYFYFHSVLLAQACCSGGTPLLGSIPLQSVQKNSLLSFLQYDLNHQSDLVTGQNEITDNSRQRITHSLLFGATYSPVDRWAFSAMASFLSQQERTQSVFGDTFIKTASGFGDLVVFAQYALPMQKRHEVLIGIGSELPVGTTKEIDETSGLALHPDLQPGRGALALLFSGNYILNHFLRTNGRFSLNLSYRRSSNADRYEGFVNYRFGNEFRILLGSSQQILVANQMVEPSIFVLLRHTNRDEINGFQAPNTGGRWIHLRPSLNWQFSQKLSITGFFEFPVHRNLKETQLTTSSRMRIMANYLIDFTDEERGVIELSEGK